MSFPDHNSKEICGYLWINIYKFISIFFLIGITTCKGVKSLRRKWLQGEDKLEKETLRRGKSNQGASRYWLTLHLSFADEIWQSQKGILQTRSARKESANIQLTVKSN